MILSFGAKNYFSFKDGFEVSLELNSKVPKAISKSKKTSTILGIKGGNASGKTNILKCLQFLAFVTSRSFRANPEDPLPVASFFDNLKPIDFYINFVEKNIKYTYELTLTPTKILREAISKKIARTIPLIERKENEIVSNVSELNSAKIISLRSNASMIDTIMHYKLDNIGEDITNVYNFFRNFRGNVTGLGPMHDTEIYDHDKICEFYHRNPEALEFAKRIIKNSDLGITDIVIHEGVKENGDPRYFPIFHHERNDGIDEERWLTYWEESDGTTALFRRLSQYFRVLEDGGVLIMDEFDTNYHPALLPQILNLFLDKHTNPKDAQFIFTSHNLEIMDYLGKYRTYLVAKEFSESYCYRLDEIPGEIIRNDRPISGLYRDGKLGGVPKI
ncbi:hypothetical protein C4J88_1165 [Pseudomonas sp. R4-39-08]|uniref:AAA family ATPase n=1 Tax=Pseudomonas sp. R4-39-08 TaxID=1173288 RepID=UPI000F56264F|nr:ATP-binding protein [Pseudomonas sp. R4-39-08]AZF35964.1 hypothetical protein C4J88_1165 [Pseudomonas sp. R4-39-08]